MEYISAQCSQRNLCLCGKVLLFCFISISFAISIIFCLVFCWRFSCGLYWLSVCLCVFVFVIALMSKYVYSYSSLTYPLFNGFIHISFIYIIIFLIFNLSLIRFPFSQICVCCISYVYFLYVCLQRWNVCKCVCVWVWIICVSNNNYSPLASHRTTTINAQNTFHSWASFKYYRKIISVLDCV